MDIKKKHKPFYFKKICHVGHGFGASFNTLLTALHFYELGIFSGVEVNYGKTGNYYDPNFGDNWWNYYFEPVSVGSPEGAHVFEDAFFPGAPIVQLLCETKQENNRLVKKYIKIKEHIIEKTNQFSEKNFTNKFLVGAFYRGTTARTGAEGTLISYEEFSNQFSNILNEKRISLNDCQIFAESDEEGFIDHMKSKFPHVIYFNEQRSKDRTPIHTNHPHPYLLGEHTLINCLLFSKTNLIIKTHSNMIELASHFNPEVPDIAVNNQVVQRHEDPRNLYQEMKSKIKEGFSPYETYIDMFSRLDGKFFSNLC